MPGLERAVVRMPELKDIELPTPTRRALARRAEAGRRPDGLGHEPRAAS